MPYKIRCMDDKGFIQDSTNSWSIPTDQQSAFNLAMYECTLSYPPEPRMLRPYSNEQKRLIYTYYQANLIPCLEAEGFEIPGVPSFEVFSSTFDTKPFTPYDAVTSQAQGAQASNRYYDELNSRCPPLPPSAELWSN